MTLTERPLIIKTEAAPEAVFCKIAVLKYFAKFTEKTHVMEHFVLVNLQEWH